VLPTAAVTGRADQPNQGYPAAQDDQNPSKGGGSTDRDQPS
jgi:hypothetical protein